MSERPPLRRQVPLAPLTTLAIGGPASFLAECSDSTELRRILTWARDRALPTFVLGGGSNLLVSDEGFYGLVVRLSDDSLDLQPRNELTRVVAGAGLGWDRLVEATVKARLGGLECLSGIPGKVGAAPIQNVGAYGQEVADCLAYVEVFDPASNESRRISAADCAFGYRWSRFKADWRQRFVVTRVAFDLQPNRVGQIRYPELRRRLGLPEIAEKQVGSSDPTLDLHDVRQSVLAIRREKSMVIEPGLAPADDPNRHSAGSFFMNPLVEVSMADRVAQRARSLGSTRELLRFPAQDPRDGVPKIKLSAAWLIEEAGFSRGYGEGKVGLSSRHTLALINRGRATAADILGLAREIRRGVRESFGVTLDPEPVFLGFERSKEELLA